MTDEMVDLVLVGAGSVACHYAHALSTQQRFRLIGVADICGEKASSLAETYQCRNFNTASAMLGELSPKAAIICTPPSTHKDICIELAGRGIHLLCEKPFSMNIAGARAMIDAASRGSVKIMVSSKFRHMQDIIWARDFLESGALGRIHGFHNIFSRYTPMAGRWNSVSSISGGGVIIDNGTHSLDILCYFAGLPARIRAWESGRDQGLPVEENARLSVETESGVHGEIELSWDKDSSSDWFITISGTLGELMIGWKESRYRLHSSPEWVTFGKGYDKTEVFARQVNNFINVFEGKDAPCTSPDEIISVVSAIEAAYRSLISSEWVCISDFEEAGE